jgi:hypothetical protein
VIGALPVSDADASAAELRDAALAAQDTAFSGYAESAGGLTLPVGSRRFSDVVDLFSDRTQMRVWWRGADDARVAVVTPAGETDLHTDVLGRWTWNYEAGRAVRSVRTAIALPSAPDLLPSSLGRRLLSEATGEELSRIPPRRVAGRDGLGLRVTPAAGASSVERVDVWVDRESGLPLQVQLFAEGAEVPALDTRFLDLELGDPGAARTRFSALPGIPISGGDTDGVLDRADDVLARVPLPGRLAGLPRREIAGAPAAVGLYGRGVTLLAVVPVSEGIAFDLAQALRVVPGAVEQGRGVRAAVGPLGLMVLDPPDERAFVVTGTVTRDALGAAAAGLRLGRGDR